MIMQNLLVSNVFPGPMLNSSSGCVASKDVGCRIQLDLLSFNEPYILYTRRSSDAFLPALKVKDSGTLHTCASFASTGSILDDRKDLKVSPNNFSALWLLMMESKPVRVDRPGSRQPVCWK